MFIPLELFARWLINDIAGIAAGTKLSDAGVFFIADTLKIFLLLAVIIFIVTIIRTFLPPEKIRSILAKKNKFWGHVLASVFGIFTPFCSCSAVPLFLGFIEAGIPLGVTFSFLVASPMINEIALGLLWATFGWRIALLYVGSGLIISVFSGIIIGKCKPEKLLENLTNQKKKKEKIETWIWSERFQYAKDYTFFIIKKVWLFILIGVGIGAWIHGYIPTDFLAQYAGADKWYAVPLVTLIGIPLYANAAGIIPLVSVLTEKGVAMGTVLAFMMAVTGLSFPEFTILRRVMKTRLILIFAGVVGIGIILTGYIFNIILK